MAASSAHIQRLRRSLRGAAGIARSLRIYYGKPSHRRRMAELYRQFIGPDDLVFDIGSHVGDRIGAFRSLGARVVAVEPQPAAFRWLKMRYGGDGNVSLIHAAVSDKPGSLTLHINLANPTISTASTHFVEAAQGAPGWEGQNWDETISVPALTLEELIEQHGPPAFVKIDVEGFELQALQGLNQPLPSLSFEFTTIQRDIAFACLDYLDALGDYRFNAALGESQRFEFAFPVNKTQMTDYIRALPFDANSGDIYAVLAS